MVAEGSFPSRLNSRTTQSQEIVAVHPINDLLQVREEYNSLNITAQTYATLVVTLSLLVPLNTCCPIARSWVSKAAQIRLPSPYRCPRQMLTSTLRGHILILTQIHACSWSVLDLRHLILAAEKNGILTTSHSGWSRSMNDVRNRRKLA